MGLDIATVKVTVLERVAGGEAVRQIVRDEGMPAESTIYLWLSEDAAFSEQYARAREAQMDRYAEEILEISDDATNDYMLKQQRDGAPVPVFDAEHVQRSRLRVDSRKWLMSKLAPKKYGEKVQIGGDRENPLQVEHKAPLEVARRMAFLLTAGSKDAA